MIASSQADPLNDICQWVTVCAVADDAIDAGKDAVSGVASSAIQNIADAVARGVADSLVAVGTLWVKIDTPTLTGGSNGTPDDPVPPPGSDSIDTLLGWVLYVALGICVLSLMWAGVRFAARQRGGDGFDFEDEGSRIGTILLAVIVMSGASALVAALLRGGGGGGSSSTVGFIQGSLWWYTLALAIVSVIIGAAKMAWEQRAEPGRDLVRSLLTLLLVAGAGVTVVNMLTQAGDQFSTWILDNSLECDKINAVTHVANPYADSPPTCFQARLATILPFAALSPIVIIVMGLLAMFTSVIQIALMVARSGMLVLLTGVLPLTAAATNTEWGQTWFKKTVAWLIAFLLYKPVAAIVYATAFRLMAGDEALGGLDGLVQLCSGLMLMILAVVALPALMRFVTPAVGSLAAGSSGAVAAAAMIVPAAGAISAAGRYGGGDSGGADGAGMAPPPVPSTAPGAAPSGSTGSPTPASSSPGTGTGAGAGTGTDTAGAAGTGAAGSGAAAGSSAAIAGPAGVAAMAVQAGFEAGAEGASVLAEGAQQTAESEGDQS